MEVKLILDFLVNFLRLFPLRENPKGSLNSPLPVRVFDEGRLSLMLILHVLLFDLLLPVFTILLLCLLLLQLFSLFLLVEFLDLRVELFSLLHKTLHLHVQAFFDQVLLIGLLF